MRWPFIFVALVIGLLIWGWYGPWEAWAIAIGLGYCAYEVMKQAEAPW